MTAEPEIRTPQLESDLEGRGWHRLPKLLTPSDCADLSAMFDADERFRSTVTMQRHGFGRGEYRYFAYPLPAVLERLRQRLYESLAPLANRWAARLGASASFPADLPAFTSLCHASGQVRPTPLLLRYRAGDYNCLHQDLYGDLHFPFQVAFLLSEPEVDFDGGEFVLTEQRPRMQSRAHVVPLRMGDAVVFAVNEAPRAGTRGTYRVKMRHGVSEIRRGERFTLGIIFHDAR
jgi:hypothetical protein